MIVLIIFGAGKLPQLGEGVGRAIKGFKKSVQEADAIETEAQTRVAEHHQAQPTMMSQSEQATPTSSQKSVHMAPAQQSAQIASVPPGQGGQPEPAQTSKEVPSS